MMSLVIDGGRAVRVEVQQLADDVVVAVGHRPADQRRVQPLVADALPPQWEVVRGLLHG
uniref:Uncharacterized protein n=1 Tax=Arundo donax TaxID=35708 RepID=A0A0A8Y830_ARUDO